MEGATRPVAGQDEGGSNKVQVEPRTAPQAKPEAEPETGRQRAPEREEYGKTASGGTSIRRLPEGQFHAFLTHDWGLDGSGRKTHERVKTINAMLAQRGVVSWFDEEQMEGDIVERMSEGIENSSTCVVFVTKNYHDKVNSKKLADNCKKEFSE